ncbi:MAG: hypothetical protein ABSA47_03745 [Verrucomicrobiota bacterium]
MQKKADRVKQPLCSSFEPFENNFSRQVLHSEAVKQSSAGWISVFPTSAANLKVHPVHPAKFFPRICKNPKNPTRFLGRLAAFPQFPQNYFRVQVFGNSLFQRKTLHTSHLQKT